MPMQVGHYGANGSVYRMGPADSLHVLAYYSERAFPPVLAYFSLNVYKTFISSIQYFANKKTE